MTTRLQATERCLDTVRFQTKHKVPWSSREIARALLAELDVPAHVRPRPKTVDTLAGLDALEPDTVIRDAEGRVLELWPAGWKITGEVERFEVKDIDLPARVLYTPKDAS